MVIDTLSITSIDVNMFGGKSRSVCFKLRLGAPEADRSGWRIRPRAPAAYDGASGVFTTGATEE